MIERSPGYLKQFLEHFKCFITDENLNLTILNNFAECFRCNSQLKSNKRAKKSKCGFVIMNRSEVKRST